MFLTKKNIFLFCIILYANQAVALQQSAVTQPIVLSDQTPDLNLAYKPKLVSLSNGVIIAIYNDAIEDNPSHYVYDLKTDTLRPARDVFVRSCDTVKQDCSLPASWSAPLNISNMAGLFSIDADWNGDGVRIPYYGDADNAHAFASGSNVVVTWVDSYCPGGAQRTVTYPLTNQTPSYREVAMKCVYAAHASAKNVAVSTGWTIDQLTDGSRDAKQDVSRGLKSGAWAIIWQEDPLGLQPGEGEGPGEGGSGAKVSPGTDIWYTFTSNVTSAGGAIGVWQKPVRITDNQTGFGLPKSYTYNPVKDSAGIPVDPALLDSGSTGASRANLAVVGGSSPPKAIVAYEETKGASIMGSGKFVRYQTFNYNSPPTDTTCDPTNYENCRTGCIISNPALNARRVRFVTQTTAGASGLRWAIFWREGQDNQGGPADIALRLGYTNFTASNLKPAVDYPNCYASDYTNAINLNSTPALNISSNTPTATMANLADTTETNSQENARAHRAVLRGDNLNVAYIYTPDWLVAENTDLENYNLYLRHFYFGLWQNPVNLSNITNTSINVKEPRLLGPPGNGPGCSDPTAPTDPRDCQNANVLVAAWGTETNVSANTVPPENLDIYLTRTTNQAQSFEPVIKLAEGPNIQGESQLRITPDGTNIYAVWTEQDSTTGAVNGMYAQLLDQPIPPLPVYSSQHIGSGGCTYNPRARFDPVLPLLLLTSIIALLLRRKSQCIKQVR
ncbi:MAG: choice-of-anchor O protein [Gammaproteobacteria bacterium]